MYPFVRMVWQVMRARRLPALDPLETHVSRHVCLPWDIDPWLELNNGRTLTLFDLGRIPMGYRTGLVGTLRENGWGMAMAGGSVRYRRRVRMFDRIEMRSRLVFWDDRFFYVEQSMWKRDGECANHILLRAAVTGPEGIVAPDQVASALPVSINRPDAPDWVAAWIEADDQRPWPPAR